VSPTQQREEVRYLGYLSSLFSASLIRRLPDAAALLEVRAILGTTGLWAALRQMTLGQVFDRAYAVLKESYRCEYLYKNTIAEKILLGRHSPRTSGLLSELQVCNSKVDLVLVNGSTVAYEIKTELDSPDRLHSQLLAYQQAFDRIYVVTHERVAHRFSETLPEGVGLLCMTSRHTLATARDSQPNPSRINSGVIFDMLRRREYLPIVRRYFGHEPSVPNTRIYSACRSLFSDLPIDSVRIEFARVLKGRCHAAVSVPLNGDLEIPRSLLLHALTGGLTGDQYGALSFPVL